MSKTELKHNHWCGTCVQLGKLLDLMRKEVEKMTPEEKEKFRNDVWKQFFPESDLSKTD